MYGGDLDGLSKVGRGEESRVDYSLGTSAEGNVCGSHQ